MSQAYQTLPAANTPFALGSGTTSPGRMNCTGYGYMPIPIKLGEKRPEPSINQTIGKEGTQVLTGYSPKIGAGEYPESLAA